MAILRETRKTWVPLIKLAVASGADIWGDYVFYDRTDLDEDPNLDKYEVPLYVFWIVSCVFGGLTLFTLLAKGCCPSKSGQNEKGEMSTLMSCFTLHCLVTASIKYYRWFNILDMLDVGNDDDNDENNDNNNEGSGLVYNDAA
eukprot:CAMPEP_0170952808 /NCGR_PEP_ID=MMETSP0735-20130129/31538_1 /TAXON_ID=186038 /ORGANISM="Fragilariopsis kerguelensis, Strain L26-C5" /LENGTH=142 /DNA_ID=CAMNT_0011364027 /DNA_START=352 /DNA_END=777 /DNA_ORIENTATION=-